jgi:ADP-ribose pyrophosphatase YjhB (NUDIX family)
MKQRIKSISEFEKTPDYWGSIRQPFWRPGANPTVDILVVKDSTEILLIQRSMKSPAEPGKWALPGGFHDTNAKKGEPWQKGKETAKDAALRELVEETGLHLSYLSSLIEVGTYEGIGRDPRDNKEAWSRSTLFAINIKNINQNIKGMDDASDAKWFLIQDVLKMKLAFDHNELIIDGIKKLKL